MTTNKLWSNLYSECIECKTTTHKHKAKGLCNACYQKLHNYPLRNCSICNSLRRVHKTENGLPICNKCYIEPKHLCHSCYKELSAALKIDENKYVCDICYNKLYRNKDICSICDNLENLAINSHGKKICIKCYSSPFSKCSKCGRVIEAPYIIDGNHVCSRCYESIKFYNNNPIIDISTHIYVCNICHNTGKVKRIYSDGSIICQDCYDKQNKLCLSCFNPNISIYSHLGALPLCRNCYYKQKYQCSINNLKSNWSVDFYNIISDYFEQKAIYTSYEMVYKNISQTEEFFNELYKSFIINNNKFINDALIKLINKFSRNKIFANDFIAFLCNKSLICDFDGGLSLINNLTTTANYLSKGFLKLFNSYKESLQIKQSKLHAKGWVGNWNKFNHYTCYLYLLTCLRFLKYLNEFLGLQECTEICNNHIDSYLCLKPYDKGNLRHFIMFLNKEKVTFMKINLPDSNYRHELHIGLNQEKQKQLFQNCLFNTTILLRDRIIVLLMLLYGVTPAKLRELTTNNFISIRGKDGISILFSYNNVKHKIPKIVTPIFLDFFKCSNSKATYIFYGKYYNTPLSLNSICRILRQFDVTSSQLICTAINNTMLTGIYQPAILMKIFGISCNTATRYYRLIKGV